MLICTIAFDTDVLQNTLKEQKKLITPPATEMQFNIARDLAHPGIRDVKYYLPGSLSRSTN